MKGRPSGYGLWITALGCFLPLLAAAEGGLRWRAPRGCPTQGEVERVLARVQSVERLSVDAKVERVERGYRLRLRVEGAGQRFERELGAGSCEVLVESAVFFVELAGTQLTAAGEARGAARSGSAEERVTRAEQTGAPTDRAVAAARAGTAEERRGAGTAEDRTVAVAAARAGTAELDGASTKREAERAEPVLLSTALPETTHRMDSQSAAGGGDDVQAGRSSLRLGFGAAMVESGLGGVAPQLALDLILVLAEWSVGLRAGALLHPALRVAEGAEVALQTSSAQLLGCRAWQVARVLIGPCFAVSALRTSADSTGLTGQQRSSASWLAAGPALQLQLRVVQSVLVGIELGAWVSLTARPSFEVAENTIARAGTLAGYARLGAAYELW